MQLDLNYRHTGPPITHHEPLLLMGSCFTAHVGQALADRLFNVLYNPTGILFDPTALARHLHHLAEKRMFLPQELFQRDELWHSWEHHSDFSDIMLSQALENINNAITTGHHFLHQAGWLVLTLGSAFRYVRVDTELPVANNHRAPAAEFHKELLPLREITSALALALQSLRRINPNLKVLFTVSPVRHSRDGLIENNRSKARLLEAVHRLCEELPATYYFPAYELVIDVLRDHRWYDTDLVHPNHAATQYVFEQFSQSFMNETTRELASQAHKLSVSARHRPRFPETEAHQRFLAQQKEALEALLNAHPELRKGRSD